MNPVNFDFADLPIGGSAAAPARPSREKGPAGFGDSLHFALSQASDSEDKGSVDGRPAHRSANEPARDAEKDADRDDASNSEVVTVVGAVDQVRTMPEPMPPSDEGVGEPSLDVERTFEALKAMILTMLRGGDAAQASNAGAQAQGQLDAQNLTDITGELTSNLIAMLQRLAGGERTDGTGADASEAGVGGDEWRQALIAKLSGLLEQPAQRSNSPVGITAPANASPIAQNLTRILSSLANDNSSEPRSLTHALNSSSLIEMLELDKASSLDRHVQSFLTHLRLDSSAETPLPVEIDPAGAIAGRVDAEAFDADLQEQIVQSIRVHALDLGGEARVRLRPAYLGEVVVSVKVDAGAVTATLQADTASVRRWMETHETSLRLGLADHGLHLDRLIVSEPSKSEHEPAERRRQQSQEAPARQQARRARNEEEPTFEVVV